MGLGNEEELEDGSKRAPAGVTTISRRFGFDSDDGGRRADMYMLREVYQAERGKAPEVVATFKMLDQALEKAGYTNRRLYVDVTGPMDTVVYQFELESLDQYFTMERAVFVDPEARPLIDAFNSNAKLGHKEIYEVVE
jgi:hypothetical protein